MTDEKEVKKMVKMLESAGFTVRLSKPSIKKTFEIEVDLLEEFTALHKKLGIKVKDAIRECIQDWIKKRA